MSYFLKITREAREDLSEAYNWYEKQQLGLGKKLLEEVYKTQTTITQYPLTFRKRYKNRANAFKNFYIAPP